jgi:hypothetical protein
MSQLVPTWGKAENLISENKATYCCPILSHCPTLFCVASTEVRCHRFSNINILTPPLNRYDAAEHFSAFSKHSTVFYIWNKLIDLFDAKPQGPQKKTEHAWIKPIKTVVLNMVLW